MNALKIALLQDMDRGPAEKTLAHTAELIEEAASKGAKIVCTQELFLGDYFCDAQDPKFFDLAEPIPGPTSDRMRELAAKLGVVIIASLFEKRAPGLHYNTAAVIDADGSLLGIYRKSHIPQDPCFEEKFYFAPGDTGFKAWDTKFGRIGVIICWDQWYPESARLTALAGAQIIFCPTAIGWLPEEKAGLGERQLNSWTTVQRGHAVANGCYYAAVNRTGRERKIEFWGSSFVADFTGETIAKAPIDKPEILYADCDLDAMEEHRRIWPFFRDRRVDAYSGILKRFGDD